MTAIQAHKRHKAYTHEFPGHAPLKFLPNEYGHVVCDVANESLVDRLLLTPSGFRVYDLPATAAEPPFTVSHTSVAPAASPLFAAQSAAFVSGIVKDLVDGTPPATTVPAVLLGQQEQSFEPEASDTPAPPSGNVATPEAPAETPAQTPPADETPAPPADQAAKTPAVADHKHVLVNGDARFDLRPLSDDELHAFAKANNIKVHHVKKGDAIRDVIVAALASDE